MDATTVFSAQVTDPKASIITAVNALAGVVRCYFFILVSSGLIWDIARSYSFYIL